MKRRVAVNAFIGLVIVVFAIDAPPACCGLHRRIKEAIAPALTAIGLGQEWKLYAPKPYAANARLVVRTDFVDGTSATWTSPDWARVSQAGRFIGMRHLNFWNYVIQDECSAGWPAVADYRAQQAAKEAGKAPRCVTMTRMTRFTPPPGQAAAPAEEKIIYMRDYP